MRPFSLLVKPASADCNLSCTYCFYLDKSSLYAETEKHRMPESVLHRLIKTYMTTQQPVYSICWQGGEPTLMGTEFFTTVIDSEKKYGRNRARVSNSVQTNATLITDEMATLFSTYNFLVGCSLDGPEMIHNTYRQTQAGRATYQAAIKGINTLKQHQVPFNLLTLVSKSNVRHAKEVYTHLKGIGTGYLQFIPCVEFDDQGRLMPFAITPEEWGHFLCEIFDLWYPDDMFSVSVQNFDAILSKKVNGTSNLCLTGDDCCQYFVVEYNGDVFPCDFFVEERLKLGNIMDTSWEALLSSRAYREFGLQKKQWHDKCKHCQHLTLCAGDCPRHRVVSEDSFPNLSWLCSGYKAFFDHTQSRFDKLAQQIRSAENRGQS